MKWKYLLTIDLIFAIQLILFMTWYYPKTITFLNTNDILIDLFALLEMIIWFLLLGYNVTHAFSE